MKFVVAIASVFLLAGIVLAQEVPTNHIFHVKYVAEGVVYLDGGRNFGLTEKQVLKVSPAGIDQGASRGEQLAAEEVATIQVLSLAEASAVCEVIASKRDLQPGDVALLLAGAPPPAPVGQAKKSYLQVVSFTTEEDPLQEEERAAVPRRPLPEINRARGRIGVEYSTITSPGQSSSSTLGLVVRANMTRLGSTYWNFNGYWRGRLNRRSATQVQTVSDLLNRTYQLSMTYSNPFSSLVMGVGRLFLPWASSLDIMDGGYVGARSASGRILGVFGGTTPDPTSWSYNPNGKIGGVFLTIERGSFERSRILSTSGFAVSAVNWTAERQYAFTENIYSYRRLISAYQSMQVDAPHNFSAANPASPSTPVVTHYGGINRSYTTFRLQPLQRLSFDVNHSYFRGVPTFDPVLIGTGLLDRYLFQGLSGGVRVEALKQVTVYSSLGRSSRSGDANASWNQMYGITLNNPWRTSWRADARYSQFNSSFGKGDYDALTVSRPLGESLRIEFTGGLQNLTSSLTATSATSAHFVTSSVDFAPGRHHFMQSFFTWQRGSAANYNQFSIVLGERF